MPTKPDFGPYKSAEEIPPEERRFYYLGDKYRPAESIEFVEILFNQRWPVKVPRFLHEYHGWWDYWEKERNASMAEHLRPGMVLFDVGAFDGWLAAVWSQFVGGAHNMVLIEPVKEQWSNTRLTWEKNELGPPLASYIGFAGNKRHGPPAKVYLNQWPVEPDYSQIIKAIKFRLLNESDAETVSCTTVDDLAEMIGITGRSPDALTIDVEGAELEVLRGAEKTLREKHPLVWVAVHPDFIAQRFGDDANEIPAFMGRLGYSGELLATDHEEHYFYHPL